MLTSTEELLENQEEGNESQIMMSNSYSVHKQRNSIDYNKNKEEINNLNGVNSIHQINDDSMVMPTNHVNIRKFENNGHLGKRKREGIEENSDKGYMMKEYQENNQMNNIGYVTYDDDNDKVDLLRCSGSHVSNMHEEKGEGKNGIFSKKNDAQKYNKTYEDKCEPECTVSSENEHDEADFLSNNSKIRNEIMDSEEEDGSSVAASLSTQSNYGKYKDIDPDDLISLYENENIEGLKKTEEEEEGEGTFDRYLDKHYKGNIIIDGKNEVDEFLFASRMAYYDLANHNRDNSSEMKKQNNSLNFLKENQDEENETSTELSDFDNSEGEQDIEEIPRTNEIKHLKIQKDNAYIQSLHIPDDHMVIEDELKSDKQKENHKDVQITLGQDSCFQEDDHMFNIKTEKVSLELISDETKDGITKGRTNVILNEKINGEEDVSENMILVKPTECVFPEGKNMFSNQSRIRLMGAPECVKEDVKIEKIGKLIKMENDVLTIHAFRCEYYLSVASVLCLENRKLIGCIINVTSTETEVFYYAKLIFPHLKNELKENIDIYVDQKHALYINVGTNICSELFSVFKNITIPYVFINYHDLYNIADAQLMERNSHNNGPDNYDEKNNTPNSNKQNGYVIGNLLDRITSPSCKEAGKNMNTNVQIKKSKKKHIPRGELTHKNNNYREYTKNNIPYKSKKGRNYANASSHRHENYEFKNMSYVNYGRVTEMVYPNNNNATDLLAHAGQNVTYMGAPSMNGNTPHDCVDSTSSVKMQGNVSKQLCKPNRCSNNFYNMANSDNQSIHKKNASVTYTSNVIPYNNYNTTSFIAQNYNNKYVNPNYPRSMLYNQYTERNGTHSNETISDTYDRFNYNVHMVNNELNGINKYNLNNKMKKVPFSNVAYVNSNVYPISSTGNYTNKKIINTHVVTHPYNMYNGNPSNVYLNEMMFLSNMGGVPSAYRLPNPHGH
ncbi:hypothetical protein, conserved [Plasmodium gonderi]|uniref:Uncharacterized protein n=1 Tax=Plasmodium gonderi TaxID=77519 RepID=A0A1Y1JLP7_PLAGO|nr:hypothetical protein, conserved [Plasmodium gonderi]GAW82548.1 hypothetical protein, conserved [Plasmodium gonderi]